MALQVEMHCHTVYSNFFNKSKRIPYESTTTPEALLAACNANGVDCVFVTDHNNIRGYQKTAEYWKDHAKYRHIGVLPGVEVSTRDGHIIALGVKNNIRTDMSAEETVEEIKSLSGVPFAVHPFALGNGLREKARICSLIEVHNATNVDLYSNLASKNFSEKHEIPQAAGSDAHIPELVGRCLNQVEADKNEDDIVQALNNGQIRPSRLGYITKEELVRWTHPRLKFSEGHILRYLRQDAPNYYTLGKLSLRLFLNYPNLFIWKLLTSIAVRGAKKRSKKLNSAWIGS